MRRAVFQGRLHHHRSDGFKVSRLSYATHPKLQYQAVVKVLGSFRPSAGNEHLYSYCNFAESLVETVPKSLRHSCRSELTRQGISLLMIPMSPWGKDHLFNSSVAMSWLAYGL